MACGRTASPVGGGCGAHWAGTRPQGLLLPCSGGVSPAPGSAACSWAGGGVTRWPRAALPLWLRGDRPPVEEKRSEGPGACSGRGLQPRLHLPPSRQGPLQPPAPARCGCAQRKPEPGGQGAWRWPRRASLWVLPAAASLPPRRRGPGGLETGQVAPVPQRRPGHHGRGSECVPVLSRPHARRQVCGQGQASSRGSSVAPDSWAPRTCPHARCASSLASAPARVRAGGPSARDARCRCRRPGRRRLPPGPRAHGADGRQRCPRVPGQARVASVLPTRDRRLRGRAGFPGGQRAGGRRKRGAACTPCLSSPAPQGTRTGPPRGSGPARPLGAAGPRLQHAGSPGASPHAESEAGAHTFPCHLAAVCPRPAPGPWSLRFCTPGPCGGSHSRRLARVHSPHAAAPSTQSAPSRFPLSSGAGGAGLPASPWLPESPGG